METTRVLKSEYERLERQCAALQAQAEQVIEFGRACAIGISGDPQDGADLKGFDEAMLAIRESVRLGYDANNRANALQARVDVLAHWVREYISECPECNGAGKRLIDPATDFTEASCPDCMEPRAALPTERI